MSTPISRRAFVGTLGFAAGAAMLDASSARAAAENDRQPETASPILLNSNENPYGPSPKALAALVAANPVANRYPDDAEDGMRTAIAKHHGVTPEQVVLGCGSSEILQMADLAFTGPGRKAVAAEPTFEAVLRFAKVLRAQPVTVPLSADFRHDLGKMAAACQAGAGLVYVCNPNNPTGTIVSGDELARFASSVPTSTTILVDEAYAHFVEDPSFRTALDLVAKHPNVVVARTFSKIYGMAGLRLGYAVGSKERVGELAKYATSSNANAAVLAAARASLDDPDLVSRQRRLLNDTRRWLVAQMNREGRRTIPSHTNFVMIDIGGDVKPVIQAFRDRNILVGRRFPSLPNWLRVTIGTTDEVKTFAAALQEIVPGKAAA
jgi:histidinol-phosphate aminotransferase